MPRAHTSAAKADAGWSSGKPAAAALMSGGAVGAGGGLAEALHLRDKEVAELRRTVAGLFGSSGPRLRGLWHAAGVLADGLLAGQSSRTLHRVYGPKVHGAMLLQRGSGSRQLDACVLFSSVAALLGSAGQANYSAANTELDALARAGVTFVSSEHW